MNDPKLLSVSEAARQLSIGRTHLYQIMKRGQLPSCVIGRRRLIRSSDLEQFAEALEPAAVALRAERARG